MTQACSCRDYSEFLSKLQVFRREATRGTKPMSREENEEFGLSSS
jgi:hypothetical protein